jgi:hypothetical protein
MRADQALSAPIGRDRGRQHTGDRRDRAVERQLPEHRVADQRIRRDRPDRRHHAKRDRQVVMAAFLGQVGWRKIDGDALGRQRQSRGDQRRAHPLLALAHRLVGQADEDEVHIAGGHLHLDIDGPRLDALERHRRDPRHHRCLPLSQEEPSRADRIWQERNVNLFEGYPAPCLGLEKLSRPRPSVVAAGYRKKILPSNCDNDHSKCE